MLMLCLVFAVAGHHRPGAGDVSPMDPTIAYGAAPTMLVFAPDGGAGFDLMGQDSFDQILISWNTTIAGPLGTSGAQNVNPPVPKCPMAVRATPWGRNGGGFEIFHRDPLPRERPEPQGAPLADTSASSLWPQGPPQPRTTERSVPTGPGRRRGGGTAAAPAAANPSSTGTRIPNRTRIEVDWSGEWYSGLTTSQRTQGCELLTRVLYDAARGHKAQACYHNLDLEHWRPEGAQ